MVVLLYHEIPAAALRGDSRAELPLLHFVRCCGTLDYWDFESLRYCRYRHLRPRALNMSTNHSAANRRGILVLAIISHVRSPPELELRD
jgi:hypothetical protein